VQAVGGLTLGAAPVVGGVVALSHGRGKPVGGFIVRKEPKDHGTQSLIEGPLEPGAAVAILEDTTTTGGSLLQAVRAAEEAGAEVVQCITIVDRQEGGAEAVREAGYELTALLTIADLRSAD
jgi:orotate phosphoribosyltransferase